MYKEQKIIRFGTQELCDLGDRFRFTIDKVMLHKGYSFKFGIRNLIIQRVLTDNKPLEVMFKQHPYLKIFLKPSDCLRYGHIQEQYKYEKTPMMFFWFFTRNEKLVPYKQPEGQGVLI